MHASLLGQYAIIAIAVAMSAVFVWKSRFPASFRRVRIALALPLLRDGRPAWLRRIGKGIAPATDSANACGGCGGCD